MAETDLPPQVEQFITFGVSEAFNSCLEQFYATNYAAGVWENFDLNGEQTLEMGNCYARYQEFVEQQLEHFCASAGFSSASVLQQIDEAKSDRGLEFLPSFIQMMDYDSFGKQMKEHANQMAMRAAAVDKSASRRASYIDHGAAADFGSLPVDVSGIWKAHTRYQQQVGDSAMLENYLVCLGCPWFARKIIKYASSFIQNLCINQSETGINFTYNVLFFGTTTNDIQFGVDKVTKNLWKKPVTVNMTVDTAQNAIKSVYWNEEYFSGAGHCRYLQRCNRPEGDAPGDMIMLTDMLQGVPDGAGGTKDVQFSQYFIREDAPP